MTKRLTIVVAAALALGACKKEPTTQRTAPSPALDAAAAPPTATPSPAQTDAINPFFYKVERDGRTSFLMGTMHMGVDPARIPPLVFAELDRAQRFAMEADLTDMSVMADMLRKDGKTLQDDLGPDHWKKFEQLVGAGMAAGLKGMKPSVAASLLEAQGLPMTEAMDLVLLGRARKAGAAITYLEEARAQLALLDRFFDVPTLKKMIDDLAAGKNKNGELLPVYVAGDEAKMVAMMTDRSSWADSGKTDAEMEAQLEALLYVRNAAWIPALERLHAEGGAFVAVGAAHLVGPRSVVDLLRGKGYVVTRVAAAP